MADPNASKPNLNATIANGVKAQLAAIGVPEHKQDEKLTSAYLWGGIAAVCVIACLIFVGLAAWSQYKGGSPSVILLSIELGVPGVVAIYCAYKADSEGLKALLLTLKNIRGLIKGEGN